MLLKGNPGDILRLRLINAGASSYFNVEFSGMPMIVIASDGVDIDPIRVKRLRISMAETYDVIVQIPDKKSYEFRSSAQDGTGFTSVFIGSGDRVYAPDIPKPNLFLMDNMAGMDHGMSGMKHNMAEMKPDAGSMDHSMHQGRSNMSSPNKSVTLLGLPKVDSETIDYLASYAAIKSPVDTSLPKGAPNRIVNLKLTGNMERYVWSLNNKTLEEEDKILIKKGENVKFVLINTTMMNHPMHLHGHFFRVLNGQGNYSPLKHTVNVAPMETIEIEFEANEEKDWFFHCHNLYHVKSGMSRFVSYEETTQATKETQNKLAHDPLYFVGNIGALSQMTLGKFRTSNDQNAFVVEFDYNYAKKYDIDLMYERSLTRYLDIYAGVNLEREGADEKPDETGIVGIHYVLPLLIEADLRLNSKGRFRFGLGSSLPDNLSV